tara:strand:+ start:1587 stop:1757 length:171 start_codon:yes stop_codon:yes gene_type:complete
MKPNQLHLIKKLERKVANLEKDFHVQENYKEKCDEMAEQIEDLKREVKKILYAIGQ